MSNETACVTRRTKGDGTIFQNKKGRWIARYKRKGFPPKEFSGKTRAEALYRVVSGQEKPQKQEVSEVLQERRRPDLNRWILVLQTIALPLGYCAIFN